MKVVTINGKQISIPVAADGTAPADVLREAAGIPSNRALILHQPNGSNQLVNPGQRVQCGDLPHFSDVPQAVLGRRP
jgi:hypothetical protein